MTEVQFLGIEEEIRTLNLNESLDKVQTFNDSFEGTPRNEIVKSRLDFNSKQPAKNTVFNRKLIEGPSEDIAKVLNKKFENVGGDEL